MPVNILNLPGYRVADVRESEREYHVKAETIAPVGACPACHGSATVGHGRVEILVHDLPVHGKQVGVYVDARRLRCQGCGKTFMETLPGVNDARRMTQRLVKWVGERSLRHTFTSIAEEIGVAEGTIRNVFADHVAELERTVKFQTPHWMGIDEIHIIRRPRAVISNLKNNTAVNMLPDRDKKTVARYLAGLPGREDVRYVAIDMWVPYREAVREVLPDAIVVVDKFHVQRLGNMALDEFRRSLGRADKADPARKKAAGVKKDLALFRKRERDLNDRERLLLSGWLNNIPELAEAYRLKEGYFDIYEAGNQAQAAARFDAWAKSVGPEHRAAFAPALSAWRNWQPQILAYFDHRITNAFTESLNSLIRSINRRGRGHSFEVLRALVLYSKGAHRIEIKRRPFERQDWDTLTLHQGRLTDYATYTGMVGRAGMMRAPPARLPEAEEVNYGVDIARLVAMLESGEI
ncbi:MAG: ISL3 family transposase [Betaproteobacteria bacterium]|nr:ISL3 family transposase [Betaproteobacteria bacterium]